ncbi:MAG: 6-phosphogluconolactonase [Alistipes sp.]|jgi:glucosamine-6-phosphate deaminase|nr:6-phosphogluconolactonase [Alistipes sp.]
MKDNYQLPSEGGLIAGADPEDMISRWEKIRTRVVATESEGAAHIADTIAAEIESRRAKGQGYVLALTTGRSPVGVYRSLVEKHRRGEVSFERVVVFGMDELYPILPEHRNSRAYRLRDEFLNHIDIRPENVHTIDATIPAAAVSAYCREWEARIAEAGGIDMALFGVGSAGEVVYNESGTFFNSHTRLVAMSNASRKRVADDFYGLDGAPSKAITMGIGTILGARRIVIPAWGEGKSGIIARIVEGDITPETPASYLQSHPALEVVVDRNAAEGLTRFKTPWLVGTCDWTPKFIRKAVIWLSQKVGKPVLKLTYKDYTDHSLGQLLDSAGTFDAVNIKVFNDLQHTITGWPGGKPNADDTTRPERSNPFPKRVIIFSPHPDDDVISMGGTFCRLVEQGHDVHVAYETSGNFAVYDDMVLMTLDTARECGLPNRYDEVKALIASKRNGEPEPVELRALKSGIRRGEAKAACREFGLDDATHCHFLNLPFYETGGLKKGELTQADIDIIVKLLREYEPHQIYAAGDLSDPHGTHRVCIEAVLGALKVCKNDAWIEECNLWLYRGAWQEWDLDMVDMAVPLSPDEVVKKRHAIYRHISQKDIVPFPGEDTREFWQRAEDRTQHTAKVYDALGMAEYQAIEVFVKLKANQFIKQ